MDDPKNPPRILFLDDDAERARIFAVKHPGAVWVRTVEQCLRRFDEPWDEIDLDHDLAGEMHVDPDRDDCGMAVVRWLCQERPLHLMSSRFIVHSRNPNAACMMVLHLETVGFTVAARPFGAAADSAGTSRDPLRPGLPRRSIYRDLLACLLRLRGVRQPASVP